MAQQPKDKLMTIKLSLGVFHQELHGFWYLRRLVSPLKMTAKPIFRPNTNESLQHFQNWIINNYPLVPITGRYLYRPAIKETSDPIDHHGLILKQKRRPTVDQN